MDPLEKPGVFGLQTPPGPGRVAPAPLLAADAAPARGRALRRGECFVGGRDGAGTMLGERWGSWDPPPKKT